MRRDLRSLGCVVLFLVGVTYPIWSHIWNVWWIRVEARENVASHLKAHAAGEPGALEAIRDLGSEAIRHLKACVDPATEPDPRLREAAVEALGWVQGYVPFDPVERALHDPDLGVRRAAAGTVGLIGRREPWTEVAVPALLERLDPRVESEEPVRRMAAYSLGQLGSPEASPALVVLAMNVTEPEALRIQACDALAVLRDPRTVRALVALVIAGGEVAHHAHRALALTTGESQETHGGEAAVWEAWWQAHADRYPPQILFEGG